MFITVNQSICIKHYRNKYDLTWEYYIFDQWNTETSLKQNKCDLFSENRFWY